VLSHYVEWIYLIIVVSDVLALRISLKYFFVFGDWLICVDFSFQQLYCSTYAVFAIMEFCSSLRELVYNWTYN
jgi:hypothetical protein